MRGATHPDLPRWGQSCGRGLCLEQGKPDDLNVHASAWIVREWMDVCLFVVWHRRGIRTYYRFLSNIFRTPTLICALFTQHTEYTCTNAHIHMYIYSVDVRWKGLANAMSGLTCASLNFINPSTTFKPLSSFRPRGAVIGE